MTSKYQVRLRKQGIREPKMSRSMQDLAEKMKWVQLFYGFEGKFAHKVMEKTGNGIYMKLEKPSALMVFDYLSFKGEALTAQNVVNNSNPLRYSLEYFLLRGWEAICIAYKESNSIRLTPNELIAFESLTNLQILAAMVPNENKVGLENSCGGI